jgi:hypothetical protein
MKFDAGSQIKFCATIKGASMYRYFVFALVTVTCFTVFACQQYSSGLVQSAARSDEAVVLSNLKSLVLAQQSYNLSTGNYGTFNQLTEAGYLDSRFKGEKPVVSEYVYTMTVTEKTPENPMPSYSVNADPGRSGDRAGRHFYLDSSSTDIHVNNSQAATAADEIIKP